MDYFQDIEQHLAEQNICFFGTHEKQSPEHLMPREKEFIARAILRRQEDFATGRWCAKRSLEKLGINNKAILTGKEGEPIWPEGICGSIAHTRDAYCAAVAYQDKYFSLGIDIEYLHRPISDKAAEMILNEDELAWLDKNNEDKQKFYHQVFCAKESIFKLFYPLVQKRFFFSSVSLFFPDQDNHFTYILNRDLGGPYCQGQHYTGEYCFNKDWLFAFCCLRK